VRPHHRSAHGHVHLRWGERLPGRGRERFTRTPCRRRLCGGGRTRRHLGRGRSRPRHRPRRFLGHRRRTDRTLPYTPGPLQDPGVLQLRLRAATQRLRQTPQTPPASQPSTSHDQRLLRPPRTEKHRCPPLSTDSTSYARSPEPTSVTAPGWKSPRSGSTVSPMPPTTTNGSTWTPNAPPTAPSAVPSPTDI